MIENLLAQLRKQVENAENLPEPTRSSLLDHLNAMEDSHAAVMEYPATETPTPAEDAVEFVPQPAPASEPDPLGIEKLVSSVEELEVSHPEITATVNRIATVLGNMGI